MATEYTPNYNLDLYASADKPNLRDQYNSAMGKVDAQMKKTADDVTNANANVLAMQTQVSKNKEDIAALESTVEAHGVQITGVKKTADDALSLAQTNETDIAGTQADVTALTGMASKNKADIASLSTRVSTAEGSITDAQIDIDGLQSAVNQKAQINHASPDNTYGQGSSTNFGHLKVVDSGNADASTGTAASPQMVSQVAGQVSSLTEQWGAAPESIGGEMLSGCSVRAWGKVVTVICTDVNVPGNVRTQIGTIGAQYAPAVDTTGAVQSSTGVDPQSGFLKVDTSGNMFVNMQLEEPTAVNVTGVLTYLAG